MKLRTKAWSWSLGLGFSQSFPLGPFLLIYHYSQRGSSHHGNAITPIPSVWSPVGKFTDSQQKPSISIPLHAIRSSCHTGLDQSLEMVEWDVPISLGLDCELHPRVPGLRREGVGLQEKAGIGYQKRVTWMLSGQTQMFSVLGNYFMETNGTSFRFLVHIPLSCHGPRRIEYPSSCHANSSSSCPNSF